MQDMFIFLNLADLKTIQNNFKAQDLKGKYIA